MVVLWFEVVLVGLDVVVVVVVLVGVVQFVGVGVVVGGVGLDGCCGLIVVVVVGVLVVGVLVGGDGCVGGLYDGIFWVVGCELVDLCWEFCLVIVVGV